MPTKARALQAFFEGFGMPAYVEGGVPAGTEPPYVSYSPADGAWGDAAEVAADLWMRTESEAEANAKAAEVSRALGLGGVLVACDGGGMWLRRGSPFSLAVPDDDPAVKRRRIAVEVEFITDC